MKLFAFITLLLINGTALADNSFSVAMDPMLPVTAGIMGGVGAGVEAEYYPAPQWSLLTSAVYSNLDPSSMLNAMQGSGANDADKDADSEKTEAFGVADTNSTTLSFGTRYFLSKQRAHSPEGMFITTALLLRSYRAIFYAGDVKSRVNERGAGTQAGVGYRSQFRHNTFFSIAANVAYLAGVDRQESVNGDPKTLSANGRDYLEMTSRSYQWLPTIDVRLGYML